MHHQVIVEAADVQVIVEEAPLRYILSVPDSPADERGNPVLCFLHGSGEAAPMPIERALTLHGPLRPQSAPIATSRFVLVAPQLPVAGDRWHRFAGDVQRIVEAVRRAHSGDAGRTYLGGFSYGGNGVFDLALEQPGRWAALWPVDPTRAPAQDPGIPVWLSIGEAARPRKRQFVQRLGLEEGTAAGRDRHDMSTVSGEQRSSAAPGDRIWTDDGDDHVGSAARAFGDERIYRWLLSHSLESPRIVPTGPRG